MANRGNQRWSHSRQNNRDFEANSAERESVGNSSRHGLPNYQASSQGFAEKQDNHFRGRRIRNHVLPVSSDGGELRGFRGDFEGIMEKVEKGDTRMNNQMNRKLGIWLILVGLIAVAIFSGVL